MRLLGTPADVPEMVPGCRLRTNACYVKGRSLQLPGKESPYSLALIRASARYQCSSSASPPRASPPCLNMNEGLPRLGLKHTGSFRSREEKFRLKFRMSILPGGT